MFFASFFSFYYFSFLIKILSFENNFVFYKQFERWTKKHFSLCVSLSKQKYTKNPEEILFVIGKILKAKFCHEIRSRVFRCRLQAIKKTTFLPQLHESSIHPDLPQHRSRSNIFSVHLKVLLMHLRHKANSESEQKP